MLEMLNGKYFDNYDIFILSQELKVKVGVYTQNTGGNGFERLQENLL